MNTVEISLTNPHKCKCSWRCFPWTLWNTAHAPALKLCTPVTKRVSAFCCGEQPPFNHSYLHYRKNAVIGCKRRYLLKSDYRGASVKRGKTQPKLQQQDSYKSKWTHPSLHTFLLCRPKLVAYAGVAYKIWLGMLRETHFRLRAPHICVLNCHSLFFPLFWFGTISIN